MNKKIAKIESYIFELQSEIKSLKEQLHKAQARVDIQEKPQMTLENELDDTLATIEMMRAENIEPIEKAPATTKFQTNGGN